MRRQRKIGNKKIWLWAGANKSVPLPIFPLARLPVGRYNSSKIMWANFFGFHNIFRWPHGILAVGPFLFGGVIDLV